MSARDLSYTANQKTPRISEIRHDLNGFSITEKTVGVHGFAFIM
jgi:hypothetical protein